MHFLIKEYLFDLCNFVNICIVMMFDMDITFTRHSIKFLSITINLFQKGIISTKSNLARHDSENHSQLRESLFSRDCMKCFNLGDIRLMRKSNQIQHICRYIVYIQTWAGSTTIPTAATTV